MKFRCAFVNTPDPVYSDNQNYGLEFMPTWVFTLASHVPPRADRQLSFYDTRFDKVETIAEADLYFFSGINQDYNMLLRVNKALKQRYPKARTIIGGPISWSFYQVNDSHLLKDFDHIFVGDGEDKMGELIDKCANGEELPHIIHNDQRFNLAQAKPMYRPFLERSFDRYYGVVIEVSRGCPFLCEFCDIRIMTDNNRSHVKSSDLIVQEVEYILAQGKTQFIFACDNFIGDLAWAEELVDKLIAMVERTGIQPNIYTWVTINLAKCPRLLKKMRLAGFDLLFVGIESFNVNSLIETAKVQNTKRQMIDDIKEIQSYGFIIVAGLIFGFDTDKSDCFDITLSGLCESGLLSGDPNFLTALPGTPLYRRMKLTNRLRTLGDVMSSTSTGGVKYETNILYLIPRDKIIQGFLKFVKNYNSGKFQLTRLKIYFEGIDMYNNFVPLKPGSGGGFGSLDKVLLMIFKNPRGILQLFRRAVMFSKNPMNLIYALRGLILVLLKRNISGRFAQFQFWLFAWSNYILKYKNVTEADFDIESVSKDFDLTTIMPKNYRETATENIPSNKIDAQVKATTRGLQSIIEESRQF